MRNIFRRRPPEPKVWSVVQDLRPFGFRIVERDLTEKQAIRKACRSHWLTWARTDAVERFNERLKDPEEFREELTHWSKSRRSTWQDSTDPHDMGSR